MGQDESKPQPGDLIEIDRPFHQHWALYMGDGDVINLTPVDKPKIMLGTYNLPVFTSTVKRQLLEEVVGNHKWHVNNKSDEYQTPLPVKQIIQRAAAYVGKEVTYCLFGRSSEYFVTELRYGEAVSEQLRTFISGELHILGMSDFKYTPNLGDMIEIKREHDDHWALYVGDGYVIHGTPVAGSETIVIKKITKELLKEVVGNDSWAVNNKYDQYRCPLPVEVIIRRAERCIDGELPYYVIDFKADGFVTKLRYGGQLRTFIGGELHILDMSDFEYTPNLGDMIEIKREHDDHWALYVGDGYVIHGTPVAGSEKIVIKKITKELLKEVVGNYSWAVNNKYDQYRCPLPVEVIIRRAERCIDGKLPYYVIDFKADGFVTKLRYGGQLRAFICGELHILSMSDFEYTPNPGDMIEIKREHDDHWALYVGDGYVIHGTPVAGSETIVIKKITKELLKEVVGNDSWAVNNKYDQYCCPLPVEVIIRRAERCIDGELPYYVIDFKADGFVTKLRYGGQLWCTVGSELLIPDMSHDKFKPNPGDMIEIKRTGYQHWALYMGCGYVIHVTPVDERTPSYSASNETTVILRIKKALLTVVARNDAWAVNNKHDQYRSPLPVEEIIQRAEGCIGKEMAYHVFDFKADDFVTKLRYGGQLMTFVGIELCIPDTIYDQIYPNPGDMIEIKQPGHHHWALYMGDGYVIHVTAVGENSLRVSTGSGTVHIRKLKVKKQLLADVARYETCCVNNKYDHYLTPCPVKEIIQRAECWIGREWPYDVFSKHSEHLVTELRYGEAVSKQAFVDGGLHNLDMRDDEEYPKPGDLIEINRGLYQHWALYVGHGYVIHVTPIGENSPPASASTMSFLLKVAKVRKELLDKAAGKDNWRVNNKYDDVLIPFPVEEIIRRAERQVGRIVLYFLLYKNCEHFVTKLRYGKAVSEQVENINRSTATGMGSIFGTAVLAGIALSVI